MKITFLQDHYFKHSSGKNQPTVKIVHYSIDFFLRNRWKMISSFEQTFDPHLSLSLSLSFPLDLRQETCWNLACLHLSLTPNFSLKEVFAWYVSALASDFDFYNYFSCKEANKLFANCSSVLWMKNFSHFYAFIFCSETFVQLSSLE